MYCFMDQVAVVDEIHAQALKVRSFVSALFSSLTCLVWFQLFDVPSLRPFQLEAAEKSRAPSSRVFLNVSTGGGKTLALLWPVVCDALAEAATKNFSLSLCFVPLLALQSDHLAHLRSNAQLMQKVLILTLSDPRDVEALNGLLFSMRIWTRSVLVFLNPERFVGLKVRLLTETAPRVSSLLFDEAHTYVEWDTFRPDFNSLGGICRDFPGARVIAATATLTADQLASFSSQIGLDASAWSMVFRIEARSNHVYHVIEERVLERHSSLLFSRDRLPVLLVVNSLAELTALYARVIEWSGLPESSVLLFAAGFSEEHQRAADASFRDSTDRAKIMIATSAYSLGIDAFIRSVVHFGVPRNLAAYLQGVGRAGRDSSILDAHCTLIVDSAGLRAASSDMRIFLGSARLRPKKPDGSTAMAQCTFCLAWRHLPPGVAAPKDEDEWLCEAVGLVCANVSRLPCCMTVMSLRFLRRESGLLCGLVKEHELKCGRCDWCVPSQPPPIPAHACYVRVISATHAFFKATGQVSAISDDKIRLTVNFGGIHDSVSLPLDAVTLCDPVVLSPTIARPHQTGKPVVLRRNLRKAVNDHAWSIPTAAVLSEAALASLVEWRPVTADAARSVCGDGIAEEAVGFVASIIYAHQVDCEEEIEKGKKKKKKNKKKKKKKKRDAESESEESDGESDGGVTLRSQRERTVKQKQI